MDKVKAQVDSLAQQANAGMAKLDNLPVQRKSDALLRSLGVAVLADRTGRGHPGTGSEIDRLITEISQHEAQNGINIVQQAAQAAAQAQLRGPMGAPGQMAAPGQMGMPGQMGAPGQTGMPGQMGPQGQVGQMGPASYMPTSPPAANPDVAGSMPGAGAGYGGYGTPGGSTPQQDQPGSSA